LESVPVAFHDTTTPELVGVVVEEPITSSASIVQAGGVLSTVIVVVAMPWAWTCRNSSAPTLRRNITTKVTTPIRDVRTVIFPAVCNVFGKLLMCGTKSINIKAHNELYKIIQCNSQSYTQI